MATGKRSTKPAVRRAARTPKATRSSKSVLDKMSPGELAEVLGTLLKKHPDLKSEAAAIALEMVSSSSVEDTAEDRGTRPVRFSRPVP